MGFAYGHSTANAGSEGSASASTTSVAGDAGDCAAGGVTYQSTVNPDGSTTRHIEYNSGAACAKTKAETADK
jgi:hypothetical protein